ncbi:MAG: hypothetical protein E7299_10620 [Lachnospiraceae bacterium]|nr:hypothetical protein [Lachnospiraceae bacterium]
MNKRRSAGVLFGTVLIVFTMTLLLVYLKYENRYEVKISHDSGFYNDSFDLTVETGSDAAIYYTTDGTLPDIDNGEPNIYSEPIHVALQDETAAYAYRFCCVFEDGTKSEVYNRDYFLDAKGAERFSTTYVVSVTGREEDVYDYENGIFVRGARWDKYWKENPDASIWGLIDGNFWIDKEIEVHATIFDVKREEAISQNCGLKIYGNYTRAKNQKSFRLIAREQYEGLNEFFYPFLSKLVSNESNVVIDNYQRLSFHNSGDDNGYGFIRTELVGELARQSGFQDVFVAESAVVFVNGKYQGVYWMTNTFDDRYFQEKYGDYGGEFYVCEGTLSEVSVDRAESEEELKAYNDYNAFVKQVVEADLDNPQNWEYVNEKLDIENFAHYMAIEYYIGNIDWPQNNVKVYAYHPGKGEEYREGTVFDGKYRYLLFDTDYGLGLRVVEAYGYEPDHERLAKLCEEEESAALFAALMKKDEFRTLFIQSVMHVMDTGFQKENVEKELYSMAGSYYYELEHMMQKTDLLKDSLLESDDNNIGNALNEITEIAEYGKIRPGVVIDEMQNYLGLKDVVSVNVSADFEDAIRLNGYEVPNGFSGNYFEDVLLKITCDSKPGITVTGYTINGEYREGAILEITPSEFATENLDIVICSEIDESVESLIVGQYHVKGSQDYIVLENNGQSHINLGNYCVTDDETNLTKGKLPQKLLKPGETYYVYGREYSGHRERNSVQVSFSWSSEEEILLIRQ